MGRSARLLAPRRRRGAAARATMEPARGRMDRGRAAEDFFNWLGDAGFDGAIVPATFGSLRGVMAVSPVAAGDTLVSFPRRATLDLRALSSCPCSELVDAQFWEASPWYLQLALLLVAEEAKGSASRWAPYISGLPREVALPVAWDPADLGDVS